MKGNTSKMLITPKKYTRKPFNIEAVEVTADNMSDVARWCKGQLRQRNGNLRQRHIKVNVKRALSERQTKAYVGDWVVIATEENIKGFKVYTPKAFAQTFDEVVDDMVETLERMGERTQEEERMEDEGLFPEELTHQHRAQ